jgi:hypothetical protein
LASVEIKEEKKEAYQDSLIKTMAQRKPIVNFGEELSHL